MVYLEPANWGVLLQEVYLVGIAVPLPRMQGLWWRVWCCENPLVVVAPAVVLVVVVGLLDLPSGHPMAAKPRLGHDSPEILEGAEVGEAVAECMVPLVDGGNRDPMDRVAEVGRLLQTAGVALGHTVLEVAQAEDHGAYCGRGYPSVRLEAVAHRLQVQMEGLHLEVQQLLHEGHLLVPPFRPRGTG